MRARRATGLAVPAPPDVSRTRRPLRGPPGQTPQKEPGMNQVVYIVGAIVIVLAVLGFFGLR
jgi:hypothetical protein